jgi:copper chaperone NosL
VRQTWIMVLLLAVLTTGCGPREPETGPPSIRYGEDVCARCGMIVSDPRYAAALRFRDVRGERVTIYDDVGELFLALTQPGEEEPTEVWVHDATTRAWTDGRGALYVIGDIETPMGTRVEAHASREKAERRAREVQGRVLDFKGMRALAASPSFNPKPPEK